MSRQFAFVTMGLIFIAGVSSAQAPERGALNNQPVLILECPILPIDDIRVAAQVEGVIGEVAVKEGDTVQADEIMARIKDELARVQYEGQQIAFQNESPITEAQARLEETEAERDSTKVLVDRKAEAPEKLRTAEAKVKVADAQLKNAQVEKTLAKNKLDYAAEEVVRHEIRSPISGRVEEIYTKRGQAVERLAPVIRVVNLDKVRVKGTIDQSKAYSVRAGMFLEVYPEITEAPTITLIGHTSPVTAVVLLPGGDRCLSASENGAIIEWDISRRGQRRMFEEHNEKVTCLAVSPKSPDRLISADVRGNLWVWDLAQGKTTQRLETDGGGIVALVIHPLDPNIVITSHDDRAIRVWNLKTGKQERKMDGHRSYVYSLSVTPDGTKLISTGDDQTIRIWELATGKPIHIDGGRSGDIRKCGLSNDGRYYLFNTFNTLQVRSSDNFEVVEQFIHPKGVFVHLAAFVPSRPLVLVGSNNDELELWQIAEQGREPRLVRRYRGHSDSINAVDFSADGSTFVSGGDDRAVRVWQIPPDDRIKAERLTGRVTFVNDLVEASQRSMFAEIDNVGGVLTGSQVATMVVYPGEPIELTQREPVRTSIPPAPEPPVDPRAEAAPLPPIEP